MRIVHTADLHLGFTQFNRTDDAGRNLRELDVMASLRAMVDRVIAIAPDVMLIAGDVLHSVRPRNPVVIDAFTEFRRLTEALPRMPIIMVAGNHDFPRSAETGCLLPLFRQVGITVVEREPQKIVFPDLGLNVLAVPDTPGMRRPAFRPDPDCRFNIVVMHGEVEGMSGLRSERAIQSYHQADLAPANWDYIALGHYHVHQQLAPNMYYSGSIDYTSSNPWGELVDEKKYGVDGKGFVERNLLTGEHAFHALPRTRDHIDLAFDATGMAPEELSTALAELLDDAWPDMAIARVVVTGCSSDVQRHLDMKAIRAFRARALNLHIVYRRPERRVYASAAEIPSSRTRLSLDDLLDAALRRRAENGSMSPDLSLEAITRMARGYLVQADEQLGANDPAAQATAQAAA